MHSFCNLCCKEVRTLYVHHIWMRQRVFLLLESGEPQLTHGSGVPRPCVEFNQAAPWTFRGRATGQLSMGTRVLLEDKAVLLGKKHVTVHSQFKRKRESFLIEAAPALKCGCLLDFIDHCLFTKVTFPTAREQIPFPFCDGHQQHQTLYLARR